LDDIIVKLGIFRSPFFCFLCGASITILYLNLLDYIMPKTVMLGQIGKKPFPCSHSLSFLSLWRPLLHKIMIVEFLELLKHNEISNMNDPIDTDIYVSRCLALSQNLLLQQLQKKE
jgi:hypothetical protein